MACNKADKIQPAPKRQAGLCDNPLQGLSLPKSLRHTARKISLTARRQKQFHRNCISCYRSKNSPSRYPNENQKIETLISTARPSRRIAQRVMLKCALLPSAVMIPSVLALSKGGYSPCSPSAARGSVAASLRSALLTALRAYGTGKADRDEGMISAQSNKGMGAYATSGPRRPRPGSFAASADEMVQGRAALAGDC